MSCPCSGPCRVVLEINQQVRNSRGICRLVTLCGTIQELVAENDQQLFAAEGIKEDDNGEQSPEDLQELADW